MQEPSASCQLVEAVQTCWGVYIECLEDISYRLGYIGRDILMERASVHANTDTGHTSKRLQRNDCGVAQEINVAAVILNHQDNTNTLKTRL